MLEATEERKVKVQQNNNSNLNHLSLSLSRKNIMKMETTTTTMRITGETIEAVDHIGANIITGDHTEGPSKGEGDNKITIEANFKATVGNLTLLVVVIIIITMVIIEAEGAMAMVTTFTGHVVVGEAFI